MTVDYTIFQARPGSGQSKARVIAAAIRKGVECGALPPGQRLAGAAAIGKAYQCSGKPAEAARNRLIQEGLIVRRDGHYFVAGSASEPPGLNGKPSDSGNDAQRMKAIEAKLDAEFADLMDPLGGARQ
jgi:DNA-binding GntR family transcriptional regulator